MRHGPGGSCAGWAWGEVIDEATRTGVPALRHPWVP